MTPLDPVATLAVTTRIAAVGVLISSLELLARPRSLSDSGLLSWSVARLRSPALGAGRLGALLDLVFATPGVYGLCAARAASALLVVALPASSGFFSAALVVATGLSLLLMLRTPYGNDGADQMTLLVLLPSTLARVLGGERAAQSALVFIGLQCLLSYVTSGLGKLRGRAWRDGTGVTGVLTTRTYGAAALARTLGRHSSLARVLSWSIILTELTFPLVLVAPAPWVPLFLAGGMAFHVANAFVMGLNSFLWAFGAAYPAIAYVAMRW